MAVAKPAKYMSFRTLVRVPEDHAGETTAHAIVCVPAGVRGTIADGREVGTPVWVQ